jgi:alcohol dehydrogenase class IV
VLPRTIVYDVDLTLSLPVPLSVASGFNAMAHAVEALYSETANPVTSLMATRSIALFNSALPAIVGDPADPARRRDALEGAWLAGVCLGSVGMAIHHKLCHILGGTFNLPHAEMHAALLPHSVAYVAPAAPAAMAELSLALGAPVPATALYELLCRCNGTTALRDLGLPRDAIAVAAAMSLRDPYWNPRPLDQQAIERMLQRAWNGDAPVSD